MWFLLSIQFTPSKSKSVFVVNLLGVRFFGELEFWFSSIKSKIRLLLYAETASDLFSQKLLLWLGCFWWVSSLILVGLNVMVWAGTNIQLLSKCRRKSPSWSDRFSILESTQRTHGQIPFKSSTQSLPFYFPWFLGHPHECSLCIYRNRTYRSTLMSLPFAIVCSSYLSMS